MLYEMKALYALRASVLWHRRPMALRTTFPSRLVGIEPYIIREGVAIEALTEVWRTTKVEVDTEIIPRCFAIG